MTSSSVANIYELKLYIIENCIYGSDIQSIAVQISKLRFFISLICDCEPDANKPNFGIPTLPNLETTFVAANSPNTLRPNVAKHTIRSEYLSQPCFSLKESLCIEAYEYKQLGTVFGNLVPLFLKLLE